MDEEKMQNHSAQPFINEDVEHAILASYIDLHCIRHLINKINIFIKIDHTDFSKSEIRGIVEEFQDSCDRIRDHADHLTGHLMAIESKNIVEK